MAHRRLLTDTGIYGVGAAASQAVFIALVPFYARVLGPTGVGVAAVFTASVSLLLTASNLGLPQALLHHYLESPTIRARVLRTAAGLRLIASLAALLVALIVGALISYGLYGGAHWILFAMAAPVVAIESATAVALSVFRAERRPSAYVLVTLTRALVMAGSTVLLVTVAGAGVLGVALGALLAAVTAATVATIALMGNGAFRPVLDRPLAGQLLSYGVPLTPGLLALAVLAFADRPLLQWLSGDSRLVGVYAIGFAGGVLVNAVVLQPFTQAWQAAQYDATRSQRPGANLSRVLTAYLVGTAGAALLVSALGTDVIRLVIGAPFEESRFIVPFSAFGYLLLGTFTVVTSGLVVTRRTTMITAAAVIAVVANLLITILLYPVLSMYAAGLGNLVGFALLAVSGGLLSARAYPVRWAIRAGILAVAWAAGLSAAALLGPDHLAWRVACVAAYLPTLWLVWHRGR